VHWRPNVLAYPSPTASQFLVFIAAMLTAGAFVGSWVHNEAVGDEWEATVTRCLSASRADTAVLERAAREDRCRAAAERRRAAYSFAGAGAAAVAGLGLLLVAPAVVRRRRRLRPLDQRLAPVAARVAELADEAAVGRPPQLMIGPATLRDAFSYGIPGRYRIALPPAVAVRWKNPELFDPVVRHELAHVRHRDVTLAWLARSVWYALAPLLMLPIVGAVVSGDTSLLPNYIWRAALLALTVQLVSAALLRARELDADLRAARDAGGTESVARVVAGARGPGGLPWYRRLLARHPSTTRRLAVLDRPELATGVGFLDGFTPAFLAGISIPLILGSLTTMLTGTGSGSLASVGAVCAAAPLLAGSVGIGLARAALVGRVVGVSLRPARAAAGVAAGLVAGQSVSLAQTAAGLGQGLGPAWWLAVIALLGVGGVVLCAGLAELWADSAPAHRRPWTSWLSLLVVESLLFAALLWIATTLESGARAGWDVTREWLVFGAATTLVLVAAAVVGLAAACALFLTRATAVTPAWLLERGEPQPWPTALSRGLRETLATGLVAGVVAGAGLVMVRLLDGPDTNAERIDHFALVVWGAAGAAGAAALTLMLRHRHRGGGAALFAAPLACLVAVFGWLAANTVRGNPLRLDFVGIMVRPSVALAFLCVACLSPLALLGRRRPVRLRWLAPAVIAASVLSTGALVLQRDSLLPQSGSAAGLAAVEQAAAEAEELLLPPAEEYVTTTVPMLFAARRDLYTALAAMQTDGDVTADRMRREVVDPLRATLEDARAVRARGSAREVHLDYLAWLEATVAEHEAYVQGLAAEAAGRRDELERALARAQRRQRVGERAWRAFERGVERLISEVQNG
jgi:Zn-dependent protease with chaperone function